MKYLFDHKRLNKQLIKVKKMIKGEIEGKPTGDFSWALQMLKMGFHVARKGWNDNNMRIFLIKGRTVEYNTFQSWKNNANAAFNPPEDVVLQDHIDMKAADGTYVTGWLASQADMLANDWVIVK